MDNVWAAGLTGALAATLLKGGVDWLYRWWHYSRSPAYKYDLASSHAEDGPYYHHYGQAEICPQSIYSTDGFGRAWVVKDRPIDDTTGEPMNSCVAYGPYLSGLPYYGRYRARFRLNFGNVKDYKVPVLRLDACDTEDIPQSNHTVFRSNQPFAEKTFFGNRLKNNRWSWYDLELTYGGQRQVEFRAFILGKESWQKLFDSLKLDCVYIHYYPK